MGIVCHRWILLATLLAVVSFSSLANAISPLAIFVEADGTSILRNTTADAIQFDSYQLTSESGDLDADGWRSIFDAAAADPDSLIAVLGPQALSFGEVPSRPDQLVELNLAGVASLRGGASFSLGKPFASGQRTDAAVGFGVIGVGPIPPITYDIITPEPATIVMAAMALLGLVGYIWRR